MMMLKNLKIETKTVKFKDLKYAPYNPRVFSADEELKLTRSFEQFGYVQPIIANKQTMHVVGGNQRLKVLKKMNFIEGSVVFVDLDLENEKLLNIALNKVGGVFDLEKVKDIFNDISLKSPEMDLSLSGFFFPEIEKIQGLGELKVSNFEEEESDGYSGGEHPKSVMNVNITAPNSFKSYDEEIELQHTCPKCGFEFDDNDNQPEEE